MTVVYIARDSSNNIARASRILNAEGTAATDDVQADDADGNGSAQEETSEPGGAAVTETPCAHAFRSAGTDGYGGAGGCR